MREVRSSKGAHLALLVAIAVTVARPAPAASPPQQCESGKNGVVGKYTACLTKARSTFVKGGEADVARYNDAVSTCNTKYVGKWQKLESSAGPALCPSEGDDSAVRSFLDDCVFAAEDALGGAALPLDVLTCNANLELCDTDLDSCNVDLAACDGTPNGLPPLRTGQTTCHDGAGSTIPCAGTGHDGDFQLGASRSFTDNGDGTITDNATGLMWEKLSDDGSLHDRDNIYQWDDAFESKMAALNSGSFAGYADWRVPNRFELETLLNAGAFQPSTYPELNTGCAPSCTVFTCSCTAQGIYWSSSTYLPTPKDAWAADFHQGYPGFGVKTQYFGVRAVRAGA